MFSKQEIDNAYCWLCKLRRNQPANADVWHLRFHWQTIRPQLLWQLNNHHYQFSPLSKIQKANGDIIHMWNASDALVLKILSWKLAKQLPLSPRCTHIKGNGGLKSTIRQVQAALPQFRFVMRTDVKGYYASIDHHLLIEKLASHIKDRYLMRLLWQYLQRTVEAGGQYTTITRGISRGCPLSPLIGAFFMNSIDEHFAAQNGCFYVRYMDDVLIMTCTRWKLRQAVSQFNRLLNQHQLEKAPDKTFIGRIEKGFDFLGYHHSPAGLSLAEKTWKNFYEKLHRLYEQKKTAPEGAAVLGEYVIRWTRWVSAGPVGCSFCDVLLPCRPNQGLAKRVLPARAL